MKSNKVFYMMPNSNEAEMAFLGCLIIENEKWEEVADIINDDDFYQEKHRMIFSSMKDLYQNNEPIDVVTISNILNKKNLLDKIGGDLYLKELIKSASEASSIFSYLGIIRENSLARKLILAGKEIIALSLNNKTKNSDELLDLAEEKIMSVAKKFNRNSIKNVLDVSTLLVSTIKKIETLYHSKSPLTGVSTGFDDLDAITAGLNHSELIIIAGRPSMGKTALALNIAESVMIKHNLPVLIFSMEMPAEQIITRLLSSVSNIELHRLKNGKFDDVDWPKLANSVSLLSGQNLFVDDSGTLNPFDVKIRARAIHKKLKKNLGLIIIDYIQLMEMPGFKENKNNEISEISRALKIFSKELKVPIIALSQLNRGVEQRIDKRPVMSDLRASGSIEQDADLVLLIYREDVYNRDKNNSAPGSAEIIIAKQRNGPTGVVKLLFLGEYSKFENLPKVNNKK